MNTKTKERYTLIKKHLSEKDKRLWCATEAKTYGYGGITYVSKETGVSRTTITEGIKELAGTKTLPEKGIRREGGGRTPTVEKDPSLTKDIEKLVAPETRGDPESPLQWTIKSTQTIAQTLKGRASSNLVGRILKGLGYSLQSNRKTDEGKDHPDRDAQFRYINRKAKEFQKNNNPILSIDTKKKENIGNFKNAGQEYRKKGEPQHVNVYDFIDKEKGKVAPFGIYDLTHNTGWVSVGISKDTAQFSVNTIRSWWYDTGKDLYGDTGKIMLTADCGGSNSYRTRLWKTELQKLATEINKTIHVSHFPPGTSKWNKIEHKLFSFISQNWKGQPLTDYATVVNLISNTKTTTGLIVKAVLDENVYEKGIKVSDEELEAVNIRRDKFHGEWNYSIAP